MGINTLYCLEELRKGDRDRYLAVLAAPAGQRDALAVLGAFNLELARVADTVSEPMLGLIRLQWWREALDEIEQLGAGEIKAGQIKAGQVKTGQVKTGQVKTVRRHGVVTPLADIQRQYDLPIAWLKQMVEARESDIAASPSGAGVGSAPLGDELAEVENYLDATSGNLIRLSLSVAGFLPQDRMMTEAARLAGIAYGLTGLIRACLFHARDKRLMLPRAVLLRHGVDIDQLFDLRRDLQHGGKLAPAIRELAGHAAGQVEALRALRPPRAAIPALLPAKLAALQLRRLRHHEYDLFDYRSIENRPIDIWHLLLARWIGHL